MVKGFSTKKIKNQETLGEKLANARKKQEIQISDAEVGAKVRAEYLIALEKGDWKNLPSNVYVRGFVLAYAKFLSINRSDIILLFETEAKIQCREKNIAIMYQNSIKDTKVLLTPKLLGYGALSLFVLSMFGYIVYQLVNFAGSPNLKIVTPNNNIILENDDANINGITDNDSVLTINNESVPVTKDGHFSTNLKLHKGINIIKVQAKNKAKKETTEVVTVEYKPNTAMVDTVINQ
jgi:cytoskeletal protein RodZ